MASSFPKSYRSENQAKSISNQINDELILGEYVGNYCYGSWAISEGVRIKDNLVFSLGNYFSIISVEFD